MEHRCPSCGKRSYWVPEADRLFHADGSDHERCWIDLHRNGHRIPFERPLAARDLLRSRTDHLAIRTIETGEGTDICLRLDHVPCDFPEDLPVAVKQATADVIAAMTQEDIQPWMPDHPRPRCEPARAGVYFIRSGDHVKIGESGDIPARMRELSTGNPVRLRIVACIPIIEKAARKQQEATYHRHWAAQRIAGTEWFAWTPEINSWVQSLIYRGIAFDGDELADA